MREPHTRARVCVSVCVCVITELPACRQNYLGSAIAKRTTMEDKQSHLHS